MTLKILNSFHTPPTLEKDRNLIVFNIGKMRCAIDILDIKEIVQPKEIQPVFSEKDYILGIVDHRESAIPVLDLRTKMGLSKLNSSIKRKWIIVSIFQKNIVLVVDNVEGVISVKNEEKRSFDILSEEETLLFTKQIYKTQNGLLSELDMTKIYGDKESSKR